MRALSLMKIDWFGYNERLLGRLTSMIVILLFVAHLGAMDPKIVNGMREEMFLMNCITHRSCENFSNRDLCHRIRDCRCINRWFG